MQQANNRYSINSVFTGLFIGISGILLLLSRATTAIPAWLVSWPAATIAFGILIGIYSRFRHPIWLVPVIWGTYLMVELQMPELKLGQYTGPISIIILGLAFIFFRFRAVRAQKAVKEGWLYVTSIFAHNNNSVNTDTYTGAAIVCIMGNTELKLTKDFTGDEAVVDVTIFMGSVKIALPPNWVIKNTVMTFMGGLADERKPVPGFAGLTKTVLFKGSISMGMLEIVNEL